MDLLREGLEGVGRLAGDAGLAEVGAAVDLGVDPVDGAAGFRYAGVPEAGCTVHWVNAEIDGGAHLGQTRVAREPADTLETFAQKIHAAEHALLPAVIARLSETLS